MTSAVSGEARASAPHWSARAWKSRAGVGPEVAELQSGVQREAANRLYQRMGFKLRQSNLYRIVLDKV